MATDWLALINSATGGAVAETSAKLERFELATKVILIASVTAAVMGTLGLIVGLARK
jgi:hypothetical protein